MELSIDRLDTGFLITENGVNKTGITNEIDLENYVKNCLSKFVSVKDSLYFKKMDNVKITITVDINTQSKN